MCPFKKSRQLALVSSWSKKHNLLQASKMQMVLGGWAFSF